MRSEWRGRRWLVVLMACLAFTGSACRMHAPARAQGTLLIVGGGLDNDSREIWERFVELASKHGPAHIVIASAATGDEQAEITDKTEALRVWAPQAKVSAIQRDTSTADTVALLDDASAVFFTGGDQKRITARYRPEDRETPEWLAMQRLLARDGVIAGASAGDAMMGELMLLSGGSARALGIPPQERSPAEETVVLGPQLGPGMKFQPWVLTDSHFFERNRIGRLVAALEASGRRLGLGVGEDAAVEIDLASSIVCGVGGSESLLIDAAHLERRDGRLVGLLALCIGNGDSVSLAQRLASPAPKPSPRPADVRTVPIVEPGQNRQLASWRLFRLASRPGSTAMRLELDGWDVIAWPTVSGESAFETGACNDVVQNP